MTSILVRKFCQPVLDEAGYPMFFATVSDDYNPMLVIYTTCGKPFAHVHGVRFSRRKPTIAESEYSAELLQQWMERHKKDFEAYVDAYTDYHSAKSPEKTIEKAGTKIRVLDNGKLIVQRPYDYKDEEGDTHHYTFDIIFDLKGQGVTKLEWGPHSMTPTEVATKAKIPKTILDAAKKFREKHEEYWQLGQRFSDARQKVQTCEI